MAEREPLLDVRNLTVAYETAKGPVVAVRNVNLTIYPNETVGLIGESGSGKSTMAYAILRLLRQNTRIISGQVRILGTDIYALSPEELRKFRWEKVAMVFQSAMNALNPVMTVEEQIVDTLQSHRPAMSKAEARGRARELAELVRIDVKRLNSYPHELSGGMRQRIVIAIAIALEPALVVMDEPTTALDVVVQRSILDQIREVQMQKGFSILFISHDFSLVMELANRIAIMYAGKIVETTDSSGLGGEAGRHHPYTDGLWNAIPKLIGKQVTIAGIPGSPPNLGQLPTGCAFHPRCSLADDLCRRETPELHDIAGRQIACHHVGQGEVISRG